MFDLGWGELLVVGAVALVVLGPKELPNALRTITNLTKSARRLAGEFQSGINEIVREAEGAKLEVVRDRRSPTATTKQEAIAEAACRAAVELDAAAIAVFTQTGMAVKYVSKYRPHVPLCAFTTEQVVRSQLTLVWGAETFIVPAVDHTDAMVQQVERAMIDLGRARVGDIVIIVAGTPPGRRGTTNMLKVHRLGDPG